MNEQEMKLIRRGLTLLLDRNRGTLEFIYMSDVNQEKHKLAVPGLEEEVREIEALLDKLKPIQHDSELEEAPPKILAPSKKEITTVERKKKSS